MSVLSMACANWEDWRLFMCEACQVFGNCGAVDFYQGPHKVTFFHLLSSCPAMMGSWDRSWKWWCFVFFEMTLVRGQFSF